MNLDLECVSTIDFETTNIDPKICEPVEVALFGTSGFKLLALIKPNNPIPVETSAIHHITDADVEASGSSWGDVSRWMIDIINMTPSHILVAHNAKYEQDVLKDTLKDCKVSWICTYKCALRIWPDAPNHKNETLRYWLGLPNLGRKHTQNAHSAGHDAEVTWGILLRLLEVVNLDQMIKWSAEPALLPRIPFGKHRGMGWHEVPYEYLSWITRQVDMDADVRFCTITEIARRRNGGNPVRSG